MDNNGNKQITANGRVTGHLINGTIQFFRIEQTNEFSNLVSVMDERDKNEKRYRNQADNNYESYVSLPENKKLNAVSRYARPSYKYYCKLSLTGEQFFVDTQEFIVQMMVPDSYSLTFKYKNYVFNLIESDKDHNRGIIIGHILVMRTVTKDDRETLESLNLYETNIPYSVTLVASASTGKNGISAAA